MTKLTEDQIKILSDLLARKAKQVKMRRGHQHKQVLHDIKNIFLDTIFFDDLDEKAPIIDQLVKIVERLIDPDINTQPKLMHWSKRNFENRVLEKVSKEIELQ